MGARWAIVGGGRIAEKFLAAVRGDTEHPDGGGEVVAVASRSRERGGAWAEAHGIDRAHEGLDELAADGGVDAWYIATPHHAHVDAVVAAAAAGVGVLVEKPFGVTARGVERAQAACRAAGVPLLEAMWTRFLPVHAHVRGWLADGAVGEIRHVLAGLGFVAVRRDEDRLLNPELAGGATLDLGVYPLGFAQSVLGDPERIQASGTLGPTGVDEQILVQLTYADGAGASLVGSLRADVSRDAVLAGSTGRITVHAPFHGATRASIQPLHGIDGQTVEPETVERPFDVNGFEYQIREVHRLLEEGRLESDVMPWSDSLALARQMDEVRRQVGAVLPMDDADPPV